MNKPTIFISHISEEKEIAKVLKEFLENKFLKTINVFASSHEESIKLGEDWIGTIKQSMKDCELIIVICSPISIVRPWINFEAGAGWVKDIPVIPLCHSGLTPGKLPVPLNSFQGGLINNPNDIKKLFNRIAELPKMSIPDSNDSDFFTTISNFEIEIMNTSLIHDTNFIYNLLARQIELLKYSIYASTLNFDDIKKVVSENCIQNHKYTFNDIYNLFNPSLLMISVNEKVFHVFYNTVHQLIENIKFILTYSYINISPQIRELLNSFLFSAIKVDDWYSEVSNLDNPANKKIKDLAISMIKEQSLPPARARSNMINYYIDYYESLKYYQAWLTEYEIEINNILKLKK